MTTTCSEEEFIAVWKQYNSAALVAKHLDLNVRGVHRRRRAIEDRLGFKLLCDNARSPDFQVTYPANGIRATINIPDGIVIVASDCHYWPGVVTTAHRALVKAVEELKPTMIIMNGDVFDGASISRHDPIMWETKPSVKQELDAAIERLAEIEYVAKGAKLHWTWGNHDMRFNTRLAAMVGDGFRNIMGFNLSDHFPFWKFSTSMMINNNVMIKHRYHNGIHAVYNNTLKSGTSIVTGHLHSLKVTPWTDYNGTRYGVDTGCLAACDGPQFGYAEDNPANHRSGFAVLSFYENKLLPPELIEVLDEDKGLITFRGQVVAV